MATYTITCDGPGPHNPASGILGTSSMPTAARCGSDACRPVDQQAVNGDTLRTKASNALAANATFLALGAPTNADVLAQTKALTKECSAIIRLVLGQLDTTSGT